LINCSIGGDLVSTFSENEILKTQISGTSSFYHVNFIASKTQNLKVGEGTGQYNDTVNKNLIVADTIEGFFDFRCQDRLTVIANNLINELDLYAWNYTVTKQNLIWNNEFYDKSNFLIAITNVPAYNFDISNNIFSSFKVPLNLTQSTECTQCALPPTTFQTLKDRLLFNSSRSLLFNFTQTCSWYVCCWSFPTCTSSYLVGFSNYPQDYPFPNTDVPGILRWTYNGVQLNNGIGSNLYPFTNIQGSTDINNAGNPDPKYMDIDLTVNDRGRLGGPYSILNYEPTINPSNGKAYIYDIELPDVINSSQPIQIKAQGYHRN